MAVEADPTIWRISMHILQFLGVSSVAGFLALYAAWLGFPPELIIESVVDKSKKFNSESRIKIKNSGKLPALGIRADASKYCAKIGGISLTNCMFSHGPNLASRLSGGESAEISITPGIHLGGGAQITACSYVLTLVYSAKLFYLRKEFKKVWLVELRVFGDEYSWTTTIT